MIYRTTVFTLAVVCLVNGLAPPAAPKLTVVGSTKSSISLKWTHHDDETSAEITGYTLRYKREYGDWEEVDIGANEDSFVLNNLHCGSRYQLYMTAFNRVGTGEPSAIIPTTTKGSAPKVPQQKYVLLVSSTSVTVLLDNWPDGGCPVLYYVVEYSLKSPTDWRLVSNNVQPHKRKFTILDLTPKTWYSIRVVAHNDAGSTVTEFDFATLTYDGSLSGFPGPKGTKGDTTLPPLVIVGQKGEKGDKGESGECCNDHLMTRERGDGGVLGMPGAKGDPGLPGMPGATGWPGKKGDSGHCELIEGTDACLHGHPGTPGLPGIRGLIGPPGIPGRPGKVGQKGPAGIASAVSLLVRHSQSSEIPKCPNEETAVWNGYSLNEDLGDVGSCRQVFGYVPLMECSADGNCKDYTQAERVRKGKTSWLSNASADPSTTLEKDHISDYISRCAVCPISSPVVTLHSLSPEVPACPSGWKALWNGYSLALEGYRSGRQQSMANTGSCLETFVPHFGIDCNSEMNCGFALQDKRYWIMSINVLEEPTVDKFVYSGGVHETPMKRYEQHVSRCVVCSMELVKVNKS